MEPRDVVGYFHHVTGLHRLVRRLAGQEPPEAKGQLRDDLPMGNGLALAPAAAPGLGHVRPLLGSGTVRAGPGGRRSRVVLAAGMLECVGRPGLRLTGETLRREPSACDRVSQPSVVFVVNEVGPASSSSSPRYAIPTTSVPCCDPSSSVRRVPTVESRVRWDREGT